MRPGVLNVDKPAGATSFTVVRQLRELTHARRVGHAGTLDPLATGVLPILFESATRLSDFAHGLSKAYEAEVHLGFRTPTDDAETTPEPVASPAALTAEQVASALGTFVGRIRQEPPAFSAVKVEGKRAYKRARDGDLSRPGNLLVAGGRLGAVIDFGCLGVGDPACELAAAWALFSGESRDVFRAALAVDDATWARGRGHALSWA